MTLKIARDLTLPIEVVGESTAILAKKGAGKSNTAKVIVEETLDYGRVQVVVLDPIGHWWSLRAGADGKPKGGYPVVVFGGMHGDLPLEETSGKLLAQTAVESGQSMILDVSGLDSNGAMQRFVFDFLEELYKLKQGKPTPLLLVLEEADEFAPQDPKGVNVPRMIGAANRISKRGRGRGIGMLFVTQRSAALNKNVLDQADTLIVMRTIGPRDRAAIESWVKHQSAEGMDQVLPSLPSLKTGEAWVWTPERELLERVTIRKARTYDSSWTPKPGDSEIVVDVKPIDVEALGKAIAATVERVRENDPADLRRRLRKAEADLIAAEARSDLEPVVKTVEKIIEVPVLNGQLGALTEAVEAMERISERLVEFGGQVVSTGELVLSGARDITSAIDMKTSREPQERRDASRQGDRKRLGEKAPPARPAVRETLGDHERRARAVESAQHDGNTRVSGPQQKILNALAWFEAVGVDTVRRPPLAAVAGVSSKSSGFRANVSTLSGLDLIHYPEQGRLALTPDGRELAQPPDLEPTNDALHEAIFRMVSGPQAALLKVLIDAYPDAISREELAARAGVSHLSSGFRANVSTLSGFELIGYPTQGYVKALPVLFPEDS